MTQTEKQQVLINKLRELVPLWRELEGDGRGIVMTINEINGGIVITAYDGREVGDLLRVNCSYHDWDNREAVYVNDKCVYTKDKMHVEGGAA